MRLLGFMLFLGPALSFAAAPPTATEIVEKSRLTTTQDWRQAPGYSFLETDVSQKHGGERHSKTYEVLMIDGSEYNKTVAIDGVKLSPEQQALEEQKLAAEINKRHRESAATRSKRIAKYTQERSQDHKMVSEMMEAFDFAFLRSDTLSERSVWVVKATPKPGFVPRDREGKILRNMQGTLWVDQQTYQWVKVQAQVVRPVSFYGFMAHVNPGTEFDLEQAPVTPNVWLPSRLTVKVNANAFGFFNKSSFEEDTFRAYQPNAKALVEVRSPQASAETRLK